MSDSFALLAQSEKITNWLSPLWLISVGVTLGLVLLVLFVVFIYGLSKIPGLNQLGSTPQRRALFGTISSIIAGLAMIGYVAWQYFSEINYVELPRGDERSQLFTQKYAVWILLAVIIAPLIGFGFVSMVSKTRCSEIIGSLREGFLNWMCWFGGAVATFCVIGYLLAMVSGFGVITFIDAPNDILQSLGRLPYSGKFKKEFTVPPTADQDDPTAVEVKIWGFELRKIEMLSDQRLLVSTEPISSNPSAAEARRLIDVAAGDERTQYFRRTTGDEVFPTQRAPVEKLYVRNVSRSAPADITLWWETEPIYPEAKIIPRVALYVLALFVFCLLCTAAMPKIAAISLSTFKNEISQPIFVLLSVLGLVFILVSIYMPYYTLGEDIKMYKEGVLTFIRVLAIFLAVWSASKSVAEEIEGRTALTVLSKPVGRRQFIVGKFGGIGLAVGFLFVILGLWFVIWVSYKPIYDGVETSVGDVEWQNGFQEAMRVIPGLWLGYMEVLIFVAISVAISTRLGILPNFLICFAIYVMGHLTPLIVQSNELARAFEPVQLFGRVIATVIPVLDHFDIQAAIMGERAVPLDYVGWCIVYSLAYGAMALLFALVLFEDRDLA